METRRCANCEIEKPVEEFGRDYCRPCMAIRRKAWRAANPDKVKAHRDAYRKRNPTKSTERAREWKRNNPEKYQEQKAREKMKRRGLTPEQYDQLLAQQNGVCAICHEPPPSTRRLAIDHDHACCPGKKSCGQCVRGLLCFGCNTGIGKLNDSAALLLAAADYLERPPTHAPHPTPTDIQ